ncbi:MAG: MalY/PatB family protein [Rubrimonas sp.]
MFPDFDAIIDRRGTHSMKWDGMAARTGVTAPDALAMWVADMDFPAPEPVRRRLAAQVEHGVFGYYGDDPSWRGAICGWMARRHGWSIDPDWITPSAGVCAALSLCCMAFSEPGEGVVVFAPVYHAFHHVIRAAGRRAIVSQLVETQGRYEMDLERLSAELPGDARLVFLCSPHNPGGRVWSADELGALAAFCVERDLVLVSDEVWHDLVFDPARHHVTAAAAPDAAERIVTCAAPSKTFNLAGGATAEVIISDPGLRARYRRAADAVHGLSTNLFGMLAAEAAYEHGESWLTALLPYLDANRRRLADGLAQAVPGARPMAMEATYLSWVDFSALGLAQEELMQRLGEGARVATNPGPTFGPGGELRARFNFACPRPVIDEALERIASAFADLR